MDRNFVAKGTQQFNCAYLINSPQQNFCWLVIFGCLPLLMATSVATAEVSNQYPFLSAEQALGAADLWPHWQSVLDRQQTQQASLEPCIEDKRHCRGKQKTIRHLLDRAHTLTSEQQIRLVNRFINKRDYDRDFRHKTEDGRTLRSHWQTLLEFMQDGGDCEDFAAAKYFLLRQLNFTADDMRIVVAFEPRERGYHAVLAIRRPDQSIWLLETDNKIKKTSHRGYRYIYALNEHNIWDHEPAKSASN